MQFTKLALFAGVAALVQGAAVAPRNTTDTTAHVMSATVFVENIKKITTVSSQTNVIVKKCNSFPTAIEYGPQIGTHFGSIISMATADASAMGFSSSTGVSHHGHGHGHGHGHSPYSAHDQNLICGAFVGFVHVHQDLLRTVIGKHGLLAETGFAAPVAFALRGVEGIVDTLAFGLISLVPTCAAEATKAKNELDGTLSHAVTVYAG